MATWAEFEGAAPDLAAEGRRLLYRTGEGQAMLATVRGTDEPPRMNAGVRRGDSGVTPDTGPVRSAVGSSEPQGAGGV